MSFFVCDRVEQLFQLFYLNKSMTLHRLVFIEGMFYYVGTELKKRFEFELMNQCIDLSLNMKHKFVVVIIFTRILVLLNNPSLILSRLTDT